MKGRPQVLILLLLATTANFGNGQRELHVAFITSFGGEFDSSVTVPAVKLATEAVSRDSSILRNYKLVVELTENLAVARNFTNSECNRFRAQRTFINQITSGQPKVALIGCGCSLATEPVAEISRLWNITHISYTPSSDNLNNRELFPNLWRTHPQESSIGSSIVAILRQYNWTQLRIITQEEELFVTSGDVLKKNLASINVTINEMMFATRSNVFNVTDSDLFPAEIRVYILNMYPLHARRIMCKAAVGQKENPNPARHYPGYVWITLGWYQEDWWRQNDSIVPNCSDEDLIPFIRNTLSIQLGNSTLNSSSPTDVGLTTAEFERNITEMVDYVPGSFSSVAYLAYDAVWTLARGLDRASVSLFSNHGLLLESFNYSTTGRLITDLITAQLSRPDFAFTGVSGEIRFDASGSRVPAPAKIFQYRVSNDSVPSVQRELIATDNLSSLVYIPGENDYTTWPDGIPSDGTRIVIIYTFYMPVYIIYDIFVALGIIFALVCLMFNIIFRNRKIVRLISPNLNYFIILGALLIYLSVVFFVFPTTDPRMATFACHFRAWAQSSGYFLCFGTIVAKMWRVYFIFNHPQVQVTKARQRAIKDWHLMMIVLVLCSVVLIFFTAVSSFGDYKATEVQDHERPDTRNENNILQDSHTLVCKGPGDTYWIVALYIYTLLTQLVAVFLAFRTRKVKIKALNDAKYVALIIYITTFFIIAMMICAYLLQNLLNADGAVFGGLLYIFATIVLSVLFIPKMVILYKDPKGEKIFERTHSVSQATAMNCDIDDLSRHCKELEGRLGKYEKVAPFRSASQSSIQKFSASTGFLASLPPSSGPTPSSPMHTINPTLSLPITPMRHISGISDAKMTNGTSGYISDSPPSDKGKQRLSLELSDVEGGAPEENAAV